MEDRYRALPTSTRRVLKIMNSGKSDSVSSLMKLYDSSTAWDVLTNTLVGSLKCIDRKGREVHLKSLVKISANVKIAEGIYDRRKVVIKVINSSRSSILDEIAVYEKLKRSKCPTPWFSKKFQLWGETVLVLELLTPLTKYDDEMLVGSHVLEQLKYLHRWGCHSDLKPGNIMRRIGKKEYFMIDFGGVSDEELGEGYRRWTWTRKWTCQEPHEKMQVILPYHDFIELGYVMRAMQNWRENRIQEDGNFKIGYQGRLKSYMISVDDEVEDHDKLIRILQAK